MKGYRSRAPWETRHLYTGEQSHSRRDPWPVGAHASRRRCQRARIPRSPSATGRSQLRVRAVCDGKCCILVCRERVRRDRRVRGHGPESQEFVPRTHHRDLYASDLGPTECSGGARLCRCHRERLPADLFRALALQRASDVFGDDRVVPTPRALRHSTTRCEPRLPCASRQQPVRAGTRIYAGPGKRQPPEAARGTKGRADAALGGDRTGVPAQVVWLIDRASNGRLRGVLTPRSRSELTAFRGMDQSMPDGRAKLQPLPLEEITALESRIANVPIFTILGLRDVTFLRGICRAVAPRRREYDGIFETFHGGLLITIADSTAALAVLTLTGPLAKITTTDMSIRFLMPTLTDVVVEARVIKFGRTLVPLQVDLRNMDGNLVAIAQVTYMRLEG